ncbi:MAG: hypothetical protein IKN42_03385 [Elusimicrobia bacterium]|nr:hypothetical protein [Elusimicrobiota bacterium]
MKRKTPIPVLFLFFIIGLYAFLIGVFPISVEINSTSSGSQAQIHRKSMIPPFKDINIMIPNLKQAVITTSRSSKGGTTYRVELEDFKGYRYPITSYYSSGYRSKARLQDTINNSIRNRAEYKNTFRQPFFMFFGLFFIFVSLLVLKAKNKINKTTQQKTPVRVQTPYKTHIPQQPESEEEKYNEINNSIIK